MLKKDMAYFASVTKHVPGNNISQGQITDRSDRGKECRNVVIMGRKTWDSIPKKFRPLKDRSHIVISTQDRTKLDSVPDDVVVASDILTGLQSFDALVDHGQIPPAGRIFVIGGTSIYKAALGLPQTNRILMTKVFKDYDCDTFFPDFLASSENQPCEWQRQEHDQLQAYVGDEVDGGRVRQTAGDETIELEFQLYERQPRPAE